MSANETPIINAIGNAYNERRKIDISLVKTHLWMITIITTAVVIVVGILTYTMAMEGSGATGILGAVVGYIFGTRGGYQLPITQQVETDDNTITRNN